MPELQWPRPAEAALVTDLYELTMAASYHAAGRNERATFELFVRSMPPARTFLVFCGLEQVLAYLESLRFDREALEYLRSLGLFSPEFLRFLEDLRFTGDVDAMPEGQVFFAGEPVLRVTAPRIEAQLVETFLLNAVVHPTMVASKAARVVAAAQGRPVVDFSPRRDRGADATLATARASWIAGFQGTSNVLAGKRFGIPVYGTMAHSYVLSFGDELQAFHRYAQDFPSTCLLLIDTFDVLEGARRAARVGRTLRERGYTLRGVRLDSGDPVELSKQVRAILDAEGLTQTGIFVSGDLNEYRIRDMLRAGAPVTAFGVGTELVASPDAPTLGAIYKLVDDEHGGKAKLSAGKATLPGPKQVWRQVVGGTCRGDVVGLADERLEGEPLLQPVMRAGRVVAPLPSLAEVRERARAAIASLPAELREVRDPGDEPEPYPVRLSPRLQALARALGG